MFPLEPTDDLARPVFKDVASCSKWLSQFQLTNLALAQATLCKQLDEFNRSPLRGSDRLETLELLRETVAVVQNDFAKRLAGKKLPLSDDEFTPILALCHLWQSMLDGYLRCLQSAQAGDKQLASKLAQLCQRSLFYGNMQIGEFLRAGYEPDGKTWQQLHALYAHIESLGLHTEAVQDERYSAAHTVSCRTLYLTTLLMHRARLLGLTRHQWHITERWLTQWSDALSIEPHCSMSKDDAPPLGVDVTSEYALRAVKPTRGSASMRYLPMVPLSKLIRVKTILLQQGQSPQQVELGTELSSKEAISLLNRLHACWCQAKADSLADLLHEVADSRLLYIGIEQVYASLAGKPFRAPKDAGKAKQDAQRQIETFGRVLDDTGKHDFQALGFLPEAWLVDSDSLLRAHLLRQSKEGERLAPNQLLGVFPHDAGIPKAGFTTSVNVTRNGHLYIGVQYLPGEPQPVVARSDARDNVLLQIGSCAALLLPALEKLNIPSSLVLPRDWFHAGRTIEITLPNADKQNVTLGFSVEKGSDFERVSFAPAK